jgi:hypothetical protein
MIINFEMSMNAFNELCKIHQFTSNEEVELFCHPCSTGHQQVTDRHLDNFNIKESQQEAPEFLTSDSSFDSLQFHSTDTAEDNPSQSNYRGGKSIAIK